MKDIRATRRLGSLLGMLSVVLLLGACAQPAAPVAPTPAQPAATAAPRQASPTAAQAAASGEPYRIGYITDLSGALAESYTPTWQGFELYVKALNDRGGINGHPVTVTIKDDRLDGARAASLAKELIESDKVIGIFGLSLSSTHAPVIQQAQQAKVPVVSTFSGVKAALPPAQPFYYSAGVVFEVAGEASGQLLSGIAPKGSLVVGTTFDSVGGRAAVRHEQYVAEQNGFKYETVIFPVATRDFAPVAQRIAGLKPAVVVGHYGTEQNLGMIPALRQAGYTGPYVIANYGVTEEAVRQAAQAAGSGENLYYLTRYVSPDENPPALKELQDAAAKYGVSRTLSTNQVTGWALGKVMEAALTKCGWPCSAEQLDKALSALEVDMGGLTASAIKFTADNHYGSTSWWLYRFDASAQKLSNRSDPVTLTQLKLSE